MTKTERLHVVLDRKLMRLVRNEAKRDQVSLGEATRQLLMEGLANRAGMTASPELEPEGAP